MEAMEKFNKEAKNYWKYLTSEGLNFIEINIFFYDIDIDAVQLEKFIVDKGR